MSPSSSRGMRLGPLAWVLAALLAAAGLGQGQQPSTTVKRFEYKYSFKPPYLAQKDGSVPFFQYFGSKLDKHELFTKILGV